MTKNIETTPQSDSPAFNLAMAMEAHGEDFRLLAPHYERLARGGDRLTVKEWGGVIHRTDGRGVTPRLPDRR